MSTLLQLAQTLILVLPTSHGVYVSADSRNGEDPSNRDGARKLFLCGKSAVCAISGARILNASAYDPDGKAAKGALDLSTELEMASREMPEAPAADQVEWLADRMQRPLAEFWRTYLRDRRVILPLSKKLGSRDLATILFARADALYQIHLQFDELAHESGGWLHLLQAPSVRPSDVSRPLAQGQTLCMRIRPSEPPAVATREETLRTITELYKRTQDGGFCERMIGGPVEIAVVEVEGASMLKRK